MLACRGSKRSACHTRAKRRGRWPVLLLQAGSLRKAALSRAVLCKQVLQLHTKKALQAGSKPLLLGIA